MKNDDNVEMINLKPLALGISGLIAILGATAIGMLWHFNIIVIPLLVIMGIETLMGISIFVWALTTKKCGFGIPHKRK